MLLADSGGEVPAGIRHAAEGELGGTSISLPYLSALIAEILGDEDEHRASSKAFPGGVGIDGSLDPLRI